MSRISISESTAEEILRFRDERNWASFHNAKDLALSISIEAAELLECFQWSGSELDFPKETEKSRRIAEELADVMTYGILLASKLGIDLDRAVREKLAKNALRYPVENDKTPETDPLAQYESQKALGRAQSADAAMEVGDFVRSLEPVLSDYLTYVRNAKGCVGAWSSDERNRMMFARYEKPTTDFWHLLDSLREKSSLRFLLEDVPTPEETELITKESVRFLSRETALSTLIGLLRAERLTDGVWLRWGTDGRLAALLRAAGGVERRTPKDPVPAGRTTPVSVEGEAERSEAAQTNGAFEPSLSGFSDVLAFLPFFERARRDATLLGHEVGTPVGTVFVYSETVADFRRKLTLLSDPHYLMTFEARGVTDPDAVAPETADGALLSALFAHLLRIDREDPIGFVKAVRSGRLSALLARLDALARSRVGK